MGAESFLFWVFGAAAVVGGLMSVLVPRIVHAVFSLLLCFSGVAGIYAIAGADFLAIVQVLVYVGGVIVLMGFGVLLTGRTADRLGRQEVRNRGAGVAVGLLLFGALMYAIGRSHFLALGPAAEPAPTTDAIGHRLLGDYIVAFEFASILLLVAMIGAAYLVRRADS